MCVLIASLFGSRAGGWGYPTIQPWTVAPFLLSFLLVPPLLLLGSLSRQWIHQRERTTLGVWCLVGFVVQWLLRSLCPFSDSAIIESEATTFYGVTQQFSASEFIHDFHGLVGSLPMHARANMPGKILLFYLLETITTSTAGIGLLILLLSNLGGLLLYLLTRQLFSSRLIALYSLILYFLLPMKLYFFPILNTVTPTLMLLSLLLFVQYLNKQQDRYLALLGMSLYGLMLFEPLPFVTGLIFLALLARAVSEARLKGSQVLKIFVCVPGAFFLLHWLVVWMLDFNILEAFSFALKDARAFNLESNRPYAVWVVHNLKDFFLNVGIASSLVYLTCLSGILGKLLALVRQRRQQTARLAAYLARPDVTVLLAFTSVLLVLDLLGVNRGETIRLWIFLGVFVQVIAAWWCATRRGYLGFASILTITVLQTALCISRVGFVVP